MFSPTCSLVLFAAGFDSENNKFTIYVAVPNGCSVDPVNYFGNEHINPMIRPTKRSREMDDISRQQKLQISLNYNVCQDEVDRSASIPNPNPVSTGLRLSYDDDERNSSVTSASGSMTAAPSIIYSLGDNVRTELDRQKEEFDQYMKIQVIIPFEYTPTSEPYVAIYSTFEISSNLLFCDMISAS